MYAYFLVKFLLPLFVVINLIGAQFMLNHPRGRSFQYNNNRFHPYGDSGIINFIKFSINLNFGNIKIFI